MMYSEFNEFKFWFRPNSFGTWDIVNLSDGECVGQVKVDETSNYFDVDDKFTESKEIENDWEKFNLRPEYVLSQKVSINGEKYESLKESYKNLLKACMMVRAYRSGKNPDNHDEYIHKVLSWVDSTDFYDAPASTRYHESFKHGLLYHTLSVYNNALELSTLDKFKDVDLDSIALCCLVHDWCKIGFYESYKRNVKNEETGQWEAVDSFRVKGIDHPFGHGVTSMFMASRMFKLTEEESLAIRWHMGMFNVSSNEVNDFQESCERYPSVLMLQFADHLSITNY